MEISVNLNHGCIQTAIKRQHERLIKAYLKKPPRGSEKRSLEEKIEGLTYLLENVDFAHMRAKFPVLSGGKNLEVLLVISDPFKGIKLLAEGKIFSMKWNSHVP